MPLRCRLHFIMPMPDGIGQAPGYHQGTPQRGCAAAPLWRGGTVSAPTQCTGTAARTSVTLSPANYADYAPKGKEADCIFGDYVLRNDRIVAAAPSCYITTMERLFNTIGPQDAEQNIFGQVAQGFDHADYLAVRCAARRVSIWSAPSTSSTKSPSISSR